MFKKKYILNDGLIDVNIKDLVATKVGEFYESDPFPAYNLTDDKRYILNIGDKNSLLKKLKDFIGFNKSVLEVGSGTSQLSNYLAINTNNKIYAFDSSFNSLKMGKNFAKKNEIHNISFIRGDIFDNLFKENSFDFIFSNGVLHHTKDPYGAFKNIVGYLKKNGYIVLGLYNRYGRLRTYIRKYLFKIFGKNFLMIFDPVLRSTSKESTQKINSWIKDQYMHPQETNHTYDEVLDWFNKNNIKFINSLPSCDFYDENPSDIFEIKSSGNFLSRIFNQIKMIFTRHGSEGAIFIFIGKKM